MAELVAEEVTRELLTPSEGTGALLSGLPGLSDHTLQLPALRIRFMFMYILYAVLARCQVALEREHTAFISSFKNIYLLVYFWPCWVFIAACRPFLVAEHEVSALAGEHGLLLVVAFLLLRCAGFRAAARGLRRGRTWAPAGMHTLAQLPLARGVCQDQGSDWCPLLCRVASHPLGAREALR